MDTPIHRWYHLLRQCIENEQSGFKVNWLKVLPIILASVLYSDCIAKFYYAAVVREKERGQAARLRDLYLDTAQPIIQKNKPEDLLSYLYLAARDFNKICEQRSCHKVGIVGEIFLKSTLLLKRTSPHGSSTRRSK